MTLPYIISQGLREDLLGVTWDREGKEIETKGRQLDYKDMKIVKVLITKGIPKERKAKFWLTSSGAMSQMLLHQGYYNKLRLYSSQIYCKYAKQIDLDMNRSPHKNNNQYITSIRNILLCYSIRNNSIGYCQGFNFICEKLFDVVGNEEETFWLFVVLIEDILPLNYFSELSGVIADTSMIMNFLPKYFPSLKNLIQEHMFINNFLHKWLLSLFSQSFPNETTYLIWDYLFLEGSLILIKAVLGIFSVMKKKLLDYKDDPEELFMLLSQETLILSCKTPSLLYALSIKKFEFNERYINKTRIQLSLPIMNKIETENKEKKNQLKHLNKSNSLTDLSTLDSSGIMNKFLNCNSKWPCCVYDNDPVVVDYLVLHTKEYLYQPNYFFEFKSGKVNEDNDKGKDNISNNSLLIERKTHYCLSTIIDASSDDTQYTEDSIMDEIPVYKKLSNVAEFVTAQDRIKTQFHPNPYCIE